MSGAAPSASASASDPDIGDVEMQPRQAPRPSVHGDDDENAFDCGSATRDCMRGTASRCNTFWTSDDYEGARVIVYILAGIAVFLMCLLIPLAFHRVKYDELCLDRNKLTKDVDPNAYSAGNHHTGINHEMICLESTYQVYSYRGNDLSVFVRSGFELPIELDVWVRILPDMTHEIWKRFLLKHQQFVNNTIVSVVKGRAPLFSVDDFVNRREVVQAAMLESLMDQLSELFEIDNGGFQLHSIKLPPSIAERNLNALLQSPLNVVRMLEQETMLLVGAINAQAAQISLEATATSDRIISEATSRAVATVLGAKNHGLLYMFDAMGILSDTAAQAELSRYLSLADASATWYVGFSPPPLQVLPVS
jgi:hypothetical protein